MTTSNSIKDFLIKNNSYLVFIALFLIAMTLSPNFFTVMNLQNIALQQAAPVLVALGMLFVILTGGIDLSVGSVMAFSASMSAMLFTVDGLNLWLSLILTLIMSAAFGVLTGILVAYAGMQGFVASLAMMTIARGIAFMVTNGTPIKFAPGTIDFLSSKQFGYPMLVITALIIFVLWGIQRYTRYGRIVIAIGSNPRAVSLSGIPVRRYIASVYVLSALLAGIAGIWVAARSSTGSATIAVGQELDAIAACVIGGASLAGGRGWVLKTVVGALVLALIGNVMNLMAVPSYPQDVIKGVIVIVAVLLQLTTNKSEKAQY